MAWIVRVMPLGMTAMILANSLNGCAWTAVAVDDSYALNEQASH